MTAAKLITSYDATPQDKQIPPADAVIAAMAPNSYFADGAELIVPVKEARAQLIQHITEFPHPDESQNATRNELRMVLLKAIGSVAVTANQRYTGNAPALLSTTLKLGATPQPLQPPLLVEAFTLTDGEQPHSITATATKHDSTSLLVFAYSFDPTVDDKNFETCITGDTSVTVTGPEGGKLRMKVAEVNKATRPGNVIFTAIKTRIAQ